MAVTHIQGIAISSLTHIQGIAKASLSAIGGQELPVSSLLSETFESVPSGWTSGTGADLQYATTPSPLVGTKSGRISGAASAQAYTRKDFTATADIIIAIVGRLVSYSGVHYLIQVANGGTFCGWIDISANKLRVNAVGGGSNSTTDDFPLDTTVYMWVTYTKGTGANAIVGAAWDTVNVMPSITASGPNTCLRSVGTATVDAARLIIGSTASQTLDFQFDNITVTAA